MSFFRRATLRALSTRISSPALLATAPRTYITSTASAWKPQPQWTLSRFQKRFASESAEKDDEAKLSEEQTAEETVIETPAEGEANLAQEAAETASEAPVAEEPAYETEATSHSEPHTSSSQSIDPALDAVAGAAAGNAAASATNARSSRPEPGANRPFGVPEHLIPKNNVLYVGNLFFETTEQDLKQFFEGLGAIESVKIVYDHRGLSKGFGYVTFSSQDDATKAVETRNQEVFQGRRLTVQYHRKRERINLTRPRDPNPPSKTLFIGNMSFEMSDRDLNDLFREIRNVLDVRVAIDRRSGQPRGFAHADFIDVPSATKAKEILQNKEIYGRRLRVDYSMSSSQRPA